MICTPFTGHPVKGVHIIAKLNLMGLNISKSTYAKLETNRMNIKVSELIALSKIFKTDMNAFFEGLQDEL